MKQSKSGEFLTIGEAAARSGVATSALRFYETRGLIRSIRVSGNHRRYHRSELRRIAVIRMAQTLGFTLQEISAALKNLPKERTPTKKDWEKLSTLWRGQLDAKIDRMQRLRDQLSGCIGCGCLSLKRCALYNPNDEAGKEGVGPRYLLEDVSGVDRNAI